MTTTNFTHLCMNCGDELLEDWTVLITLAGAPEAGHPKEVNGFCGLGCARDWLTWAMRDPWYLAS